MEYALNGKRKTLNLASYPDITLRRARELRYEARKLLAEKIDPVVARQAERRAKVTSYETVAYEWLGKQSFTDRYTRTTKTRIERSLLPRPGSRPITEIKVDEIRDAFTPIENAGNLETLRT